MKVLKCVYHYFVTASGKPVKMLHVMSRLDVNIVAKRSELNSSLIARSSAIFLLPFLGVCSMHRTVMYSLPFAEVTHSFREETGKVNCRKSVCVRRLHATSHDCIQVSNYSFDICKFCCTFSRQLHI